VMANSFGVRRMGWHVQDYPDRPIRPGVAVSGNKTARFRRSS
jgi:hypothetical protein